MSFFGFDTALPDDPRAKAQGQGQQSQFASRADQDTFGSFDRAGEEDLAVYNWGEGGLLESGDDFNDETFGDTGDFGNDFQFAAAPEPAQSKPKVASTTSRFGPKAQVDLFAATEDDFYTSRPATKSKLRGTTPYLTSEPTKTPKKKNNEPQPLWANASPANAWGAAPIAPPVTGHQPSKILSLEEIEAEMARASISKQQPSQQYAPHQPQYQPSPQHVPQQYQQPPQHAQQQGPGQQVLSLEEIERQMIGGPSPGPGPQAAPQHLPVGQPPRSQAQAIPPGMHGRTGSAQMSTPPIAGTPPTAGLHGSGYAKQQALLDSMFPDLHQANQPGQPGQPPVAPQHPGTPGFQGPPPGQPQPSPEEIARMEELHKRITAKIESMSKYNNLMGNSDKDFITRIQLSQLATSDPYSSDFYAQVFSALARRAQDAQGSESGPTVVQIAPGMGLGVGGPVGNRFGKMGSATMNRLTTQVKKLVSTTAKRQQAMSSDALAGALGRVRRGANQAAPRPVLAVPKPEHRPAPVAQLNHSSGPTREPLTRKQVMYALEELYDDCLDLEQMRREAPPPTDVPRVEAWNAQCAAKVDDLWRKLMVMEPLGVSTPHPFISLINPLKGQRLFPRLLRHLDHQRALTLLTLLIATYPQLDVVARAPPPPVADVSLLTKADREDRARREAETDSFLHCVIPGVDMLINQCNLGLVAGLLGICTQRMELGAVAATRPGVALFTALLSRAQSLVRGDAPIDPVEREQWTKTFDYFLQTISPHLPDLFPATLAQKAAFGPGAYLLSAEGQARQDRDNGEMERREAEVWGLAAALAVNAPEDQQTNLVAALRDKILHTVQSARDPKTPREKAELKLRNVNMFLHGLGLDASMIE